MRISILLACVLIAGCATAELGPACAKTDWYQQGYVDAERTWYSRVDEHEANCAKAGVKIDANAYQRGWAEGRFSASHKNFGRLP